jgi:hypothetical protein
MGQECCEGGVGDVGQASRLIGFSLVPDVEGVLSGGVE